MTVATIQPRSISTTSSTLRTSITGFDKIDLRLIDWQVLPGHELQIHHKGNQKQKSFLFYVEDQPVYGYGAHYRTNWWNLFISVPRPGTRHCLLGFNPSKHKHLINYPASTTINVLDTTVTLQRRLQQIGIQANLRTAAIRKLEVCSDIEVDSSLEAYWEALADCRPPSRMKMRRYPNGVTWFNKQAAVKVYGKYTQLMQEYGAKALEKQMPPENTIRFETAVQTPASVRKKIGNFTLDDTEGLSNAAINWHVNMGRGLFNG